MQHLAGRALRQKPWLPAMVLLALAGFNLPARSRAAEALPATVEFNRDIRPILSETCFQCHGPDKAKRKADLRLDLETDALADRDGTRAIVPGKPQQSELFRRITAADESERMPPARTGKKLTDRQIGLIRRWIEQGAKWQPHWSLISPRQPPVPAVQNANWPRNPIDHFILARLESEGLTPSPQANKTNLIRRVTLDLTGLPPTPAEVDAFLADTAPDAYEKVVNRLLNSPRFGERMAVRWLDAARYADTSGYQNDGPRVMWRWRDWVIDALNANMPFDRFTIEQLAGDLLPKATLDQKLATGFNRNHRGNAEGGIIPEEYAVEYVVDRVDTTATVWLGLTMGCARCHDHKYDPVTQKEFYRLFAYFNNVPEFGRAIKEGNSPPYIHTPTREQQDQLQALEAKLHAAEARFAALGPQLAAAQAQWEKSQQSGPPVRWWPTEDMVLRVKLDGNARESTGVGKETRFDGGPPGFVPGKLGLAGDFDGKRFIHCGDVAKFGYFDKFTLAAWVYPKGPKGGTILSKMTDLYRADGYYLVLDNGKLQVNLVRRWLDDALRVETEAPLPADRWCHVAVTYDGSRVADAVKVYLDGKPAKLKVNLDGLNQTFATSEPFRIGRGSGAGSEFHGYIDDVRAYATNLPANLVEALATPEPITDIVALPAAKRTPHQASKLRAYFLEQHAPETIRQAHRQVQALQKEHVNFVESLPTTMVMAEMPIPRDTFVLIRGEYDKHGEKVAPGVPASLTPLPKGAAANRLGFARWVVDPSNPLTGRVTVNRFWQMLFGTGLVKTTEDFGSQGEWPSHPELLDWLATEFVRTGWDVKGMLRTLVTSATYRQSSNVTPALLQKDPENRLLARGPRFRLSAEVIRDQALAASGLLVEKVGGPSVKPYQPAGLWKEIATDTDYNQDHGPSLYRRSLYTYWKRTVSPPAMVAFDATTREACCVRETRTNSPLQALTLMNEVTFVEAARVLAQRVMTEGGADPEGRLVLAFRLATSRPPNPGERRILLDGFRHHLDRFGKDREAALKLLSVGEFPRNDKLDVAEVAAWTAVASLILNLDETITKE